MRKKSKKIHLTRPLKIVIAIVALLVILRLILPYIVLRYCNKTLSELDGYYGHVDDIDIALYRGAYQINDMYLNKVDKKTRKQTEFFKVKNIDFSVEWKALFDGSLVGELVINTPKLVFTKDKTEISEVKKDTTDFRKILEDFMPLKINRFEINHGSIHYADQGSTPKVDISMQDVYVLAQNLKNTEDNKNSLPSPVNAHANVYGGMFTLNMRLDALAKKTRFDLNADMKNANLASVNDFLKAYGGFDVNKGTISVYTEFASKDGKYKGYVKPVIKDLDVVGPEDRHDKFLQKIWENIVGGAGHLLKNHKKDQVATRVPMEGSFEGSSTNTIEAIWELLKNAFIQALLPSIDDEITLSSVGTDTGDHKTLLQKIFGGGDKDKDKKDEKKKDEKKN